MLIAFTTCFHDDDDDNGFALLKLGREVLDASLKHVQRWGWSEETLAAGAKDLVKLWLAHLHTTAH